MIKVAFLPLGLTILLASMPAAQAQVPATQAAVNEALYRQAKHIALQQRLVEARDTQQRGQLAAAAKLYDDAWNLVTEIGSGVEPEAQQVKVGLGTVRLELARSAQRRGDLREAHLQVRDVLRVDPGNAAAQDFLRENDRLLAMSNGKMPSETTINQVPTIITNRTEAAILVQDGKLLYENGKLDEAEAKLKQAVERDPGNQAAYYYLNLIRECKYNEALNKRDVESRSAMVSVEEAWESARQRELLPRPNLYARTNLSHVSKGRQIIVNKLDRIQLDDVGPWDNLPLTEVVSFLSKQASARDPEKHGLNFIINPNVEAGGALAGTTASIDPATGLPAAGGGGEKADIFGMPIKLNPALHNIRLADALDAIVKVADPPLKYTIEDYAVVFSLKGRENAQLFYKTIKVDPNTFEQGLQSVTAFDFGAMAQSSGGSGGSSGGGGMSSMGGGGSSGGILSIPRVSVAGGGMGGGMGGGGRGLRGITSTNLTESVQLIVRTFFIGLGVDLQPNENIFFNDREGSLLVHATAEHIDIIENAVEDLNKAPPQVTIKVKFIEITQNDNRALGFEWYLGNFLMNRGSIIGTAGTAPSYGNNPGFPGNAAAGTAIAPSASDGLLTGGLRTTANNMPTAPTLATFTGILTQPQFRVAINALQQRDGVDMLSDEQVTTLSGRQTQVQVVDLQTIVTGSSLSQSGSGGANGLTGAGTGVVAAASNYQTSTMPFGPSLDVIPYVSADGYTIQMTLIPTITEFIGYDDPGAFVPQAQSVSSGGAAVPITAQLPLPHYRLRQVTTSTIVWDGQTVVLGGLITENVSKLKDEVPVLGDIPVLGRLFRSEATTTAKKNLLIFVTPTIIDPAGNRYHSDDEMPFAQTRIPPQRPLVTPPPSAP